MSFDRRDFLVTIGALGAGALLPGPAKAKAPMAGAQAVGLARVKIGTIEVTAISDGFLDIALNLFKGADEAAIKRQLAANFRPEGPHRSSVNAYVINTGDKLAVVDTGTIAGFSPTLGRFHAALAAAGFEAGAVDALLLTHLHPDHAGGMAGAGGAAAFPNAELFVHDKEIGFWTDEGISSRAPDAFKPFFQIAQSAVKPYAARTRRFKGGDEIIPGVTAVELFGHTPGHAGFRIASGGQQMLIWADIIHGPALQFSNPAITIGFDADEAGAKATRLKVMSEVASDKLLIAGSHLDFPGFGYVMPTSSGGFAFQAAPFGLGL